MATDWAADVKKYAPNADDGIIGGIVRYCGIALRNRDSSLVSFSDPTELARVRNNFLKKKLGLTHADSVLDAAIAKVGETMKADRTKNRVTVYYLLADAYKSLHLFEKKGAAKAAAKAPAKAAPKTAKAAVAGAAGAAAFASLDGAKKKAPAKKPAAKKAAAPKAAAVKVAAPQVAPAPTPAPKPIVAPVAAAALAATAAGAAALGSAASGAADTAVKAGGAAAGAAGTAATAAAAKVSGAAQGLTGSSDDSNEGGLGWLWILLGLALLTLLAWWLFSRKPAEDASVGAVATEAVASDAAAAGAAPTDLSSAPAEGTATIPTGAGVTSETRDGKPVVKVYFDTGKTDVAPAFADTAGGLKAWLDGHAGSTLAVSGYNDPTGNAARNAQLSKNRAKAVAADLVKAGIPEASVALVKPEASTDANVPKEAARRVEVTVQ
ncbi:MAG: DUF2853 family protein [Novosphingobium sp.]|uniref:DUF2853 family protein n=1 Tax=Novosphingobium sp. TaxID=1874826 RepID=UPI0032B72015